MYIDISVPICLKDCANWTIPVGPQVLLLSLTRGIIPSYLFYFSFLFSSHLFSSLLSLSHFLFINPRRGSLKTNKFLKIEDLEARRLSLGRTGSYHSRVRRSYLSHSSNPSLKFGCSLGIPRTQGRFSMY